MRTAGKVTLVLLLGTAIVSVVAANYYRDPELFHFRWKLYREPPLDVRLAPVARSRIIRTVEAPGKVEADLEVKISAQVVGRIVGLPVREGQQVPRDGLLVQLDRVQFEAEVRSAEARVKRLRSSIEVTEADLAKTQRDLERNRKLFGSQAVSTTDVVDLQTVLRKDQARLAMAKAELGEAEAALVRAQEDLLRTTIRSPLPGVITQLMAKEGEVVVIGTMNNPGTVLLTISDPATMVVRARVDENNVALVQPGQKTTIHLQNNDQVTLTGTVERVSPKGTRPGGTSSTQTTSDNEVAVFETIIRLDAPSSHVRLGMNANVEIEVDRRDDVLAIPAQAVLHRRARDLPRALGQRLEEAPRGPGVKDPARRYHQVVFVYEDGKASCRLVRIGVSDQHRAEVLEGLQPGDTVIAGPYRVLDKLREGRAVTALTETDDRDGS